MATAARTGRLFPGASSTRGVAAGCFYWVRSGGADRVGARAAAGRPDAVAAADTGGATIVAACGHQSELQSERLRFTPHGRRLQGGAHPHLAQRVSDLGVAPAWRPTHRRPPGPPDRRGTRTSVRVPRPSSSGWMPPIGPRRARRGAPRPRSPDEARKVLKLGTAVPVDCAARCSTRPVRDDARLRWRTVVALAAPQASTVLEDLPSCLRPQRRVYPDDRAALRDRAVRVRRPRALPTGSDSRDPGATSAAGRCGADGTAAMSLAAHRPVAAAVRRFLISPATRAGRTPPVRHGVSSKRDIA